jgi:molybdopterin-guanine dinucleotide biosynthesis protein A
VVDDKLITSGFESPPMPDGLIVAGGFSTRFDERDKAVAELAGTPMLRRVADRLAPAVDALVVNCREAQVTQIRQAMSGYALPVTYAEDETPDQGPLAGIDVALDDVASEYVFVTACDMPFIDPTLVSSLLETARTDEAAVPRVDDTLQPLHAAYETAALREASQAALERGDRGVRDVLKTLDCVVVEESTITTHGSLESVQNVNTISEFEDAENRL